MSRKLNRGEYPSGHSPNDFVCFGPPATEDGKFDSAMLADLGCFNQEGVDSNKYYFGCVCQSKKDQTFYAYFEWGRTGKSGEVQFFECSSKEEAHAVFAKQMHEKNDKRGEWATIAGLKVLRAKTGKDCYLVRPQAKRTVGLPDAQNLVHDESLLSKSDSGGGTALAVAEPKTGKKTKKIVKGSTAKRWDAQTLSLLKDMNALAVDYTRKSIEGGAIPTQGAIEEARDILTAAKKRLLKVGRQLDDQLTDSDLRQLSYMIYSRIGKAKRVGAPDSEWILSEQNIDRWSLDIDAFENALNAIELGAEEDEKEYDPFQGTDIEMIHIDKKTAEGDFLFKWMPTATANKHGHVGDMVIKNMWAIRQRYQLPKFDKTIAAIAAQGFKAKERPLFQPTRTDIPPEERKVFEKANVSLLFHGTRSVNVPGIIRTGLRLPKELVGVVITGAMFGPGIYWADDWKKSDGYTSREGGYWAGGGGGVRGRGAFMFAANVAVGNPYVADGPQGFTSPPRGHHSVFGKAGVSRVHNNEWIIFDSGQNTLAYLAEYDVKGRW
jgi:predicted DNA-binding WGR domain protein